MSAQLLTIGTEITSGEVVNTNASWLSLRLEDLGIRVFSHLTVRDQREEILSALGYAQHSLIFVTGGLGPTSDDLTRVCMATYWGVPLDFDDQVWEDLKSLYQERQLPLREAHRWQCHFPRGSEKLSNRVGTALGFYQKFQGRHYFVLPGPPRELEAIWEDEVLPRLLKWRESSEKKWMRWTCLGAPESEVAEAVEPLIQGHDLEVGYRAQVPYVKVKLFVDPIKNKDLIELLEKTLEPWLVARGFDDLAEQLLLSWPKPELVVADQVTQEALMSRLLGARAQLVRQKRHSPLLKFDSSAQKADFILSCVGEEFQVSVFDQEAGRKVLPYKVSLNSERGRRSATEWSIWMALCALRARSNQS